MKDGCVQYIYCITSAENSIRSQLGSPCQGNRYGAENHTCRVTLLQPARRAAVLGQNSSLRPHWSVAANLSIGSSVFQLNFLPSHSGSQEVCQSIPSLLHFAPNFRQECEPFHWIFFSLLFYFFRWDFSEI
jgi:hypothetical protein